MVCSHIECSERKYKQKKFARTQSDHCRIGNIFATTFDLRLPRSIGTFSSSDSHFFFSLFENSETTESSLLGLPKNGGIGSHCEYSVGGEWCQDRRTRLFRT